MKKYLLMVVLLLTGLMVFVTAAFSPTNLSQDNSIFFDDFESYINSTQLKTSYTVWEDGAVLDIALEKGHLFSGLKSMRVDVIGPNPQSLSTSASIYHLLQFTESNWSDGAGIRLWVENLSRFPLSLTFNFKEMHNEFWAIAENSVFYLVTSDNEYLQQQGQYGNLIIPAFYKGFLYIPFESFSVPVWNSAKGDEKMDLSKIESFSFGMNITATELQRLFIDDLEIVSLQGFNLAQIKGNPRVEIPTSGEHREQYSLIWPSIVDGPSSAVPVWSIEQSSNSGVMLDAEGWLTIPAGTKPGQVALSANYSSLPESAKTKLVVTLFDPQLTESLVSEKIVVPDEIKAIENKNSAYLQFANQFETWASENRTWFVIIAISGVMLILIGLTFMQNRLK